MTLTDSQKITVTFRIEPGCLGPQGVTHVDRFCTLARAQLQAENPPFINWEVVPRHDKTLPEMDFSINGKALSREFAVRYMDHFGVVLDEFEMNIFNELPDMIDQFFGR